MATSTILGGEMSVSAAGAIVAGSKGFSLARTAELIDTADLSDGLDSSNRPGKKTWIVSVDALLTTDAAGYKALSDAMEAGVNVALILTNVGGEDYAGSATLTSLEVSSNSGAEVGTYSASFEGASGLTITTTA